MSKLSREELGKIEKHYNDDGSFFYWLSDLLSKDELAELEKLDNDRYLIQSKIRDGIGCFEDNIKEIKKIDFKMLFIESSWFSDLKIES